MWAGIIALGDQSRIAMGGTALNSAGVLSSFYGAYNSSAYHSDFHDVLTGNNGFAAGPGYDLVTGIGSPIAPSIVSLLANASAPAAAVQLSVGSTSGPTSNPTIKAHAATAQVARAAVPTAAMSGAAPAATTFGAQIARVLATNNITISQPAAGQAVRADTAFFTALPGRATATVDGFHGTIEGTPATTTELTGDIDDLSADGPADSVATPTARLFNDALPTTVAASVSDAVFADVSADLAADGSAPTPVAVLAADEAHPVDFAMMAGIALALGGSWSGFAKNQENRKVPVLRS